MPEGPIKTYAISKNWRLARVGGGIFLIMTGLFFYSAPFWDHFYNPLSGALLFSALGSIANLFGTYLIANSYKYRFEVWPDRIRSIGLLGARELEIPQIDGFRIPRNQRGGGGIVFFISRRAKKSIRVFQMLEEEDAFRKWLETQFKNLDEVEAQKELGEAMADERLGTSADQRAQNLARVKKAMGILVLLVFLFCLFGLHMQVPYRLFIGFLVLAPLMVLALPLIFPEAIRFNTVQRSPYAGVDLLAMTPASFLAIRAIEDWNILEWKNFWVPFFMISLALYGYLLAIPDFRKLKQNIFFAGIFFSLLFGSSATVCLNGILDKSVPAHYGARVVDKRMDRDRHGNFYYMTLLPWGTMTAPKEYRAGLKAYEQYSAGDWVTVAVRQGAFKIPIYFIY